MGGMWNQVRKGKVKDEGQKKWYIFLKSTFLTETRVLLSNSMLYAKSD